MPSGGLQLELEPTTMLPDVYRELDDDGPEPAVLDHEKYAFNTETFRVHRNPSKYRPRFQHEHNRSITPLSNVPSSTRGNPGAKLEDTLEERKFYEHARNKAVKWKLQVVRVWKDARVRVENWYQKNYWWWF